MKSGWVAALTLGLLLWCGVARAECTKDIECKGDRVCREGVCADVTPATAATTTSAPPEQQPTQPRQLRRRSTGMMVTGIVLTSLSVVALAGGVAYGFASSSCRSDVEEEHPDRVLSASAVARWDECNEYGKRATVLLLAHLPLAGVGIPLWAVGARRVPVARATLSPWLAPRVSGVRFVLTL